MLLLSFLVLTGIRAQSESCFLLQEQNEGLLQVYALNKLITTNTSLSIHDICKGAQIAGVSIDAKIQRTSINYHVRVVAKDIKGKEYQIIEAFKELWDEGEFDIQNYCEESSLLGGVVLDSIKVFLDNATIRVTKIHLAIQASNHTNITAKTEKEDLRRKQAETIVNKINDYNKSNNKLWVAGLTKLSYKSYEEKKKLFNIGNGLFLDGFEYYVGGIFEIPSEDTKGVKRASNLSINGSTSSYVENFDWRCRHGKDWTTPIKSQGESSYCVAFASTATLESLVNIYKNNKIDLSLSVQEIGCCASDCENVYDEGMLDIEALDYLKYNGVCDSLSYPFADEPGHVCESDSIIPQMRIYISDYSMVPYNPDSIKKALIHKGPLLSGYRGHAMSLIGYGKVNAGDSLFYYMWVNGNPTLSYIIIQDDDPRIGKTFWIFKNSLVDNGYSKNGYTYLLYGLDEYVEECYSYTLPSYPANEVLCLDEDGDGLYNWGLGSKPSNCPPWVPDIEDGDDSNINYGAIDYYGNLEELPQGITINTPQTYSSNSSTQYRLGIVNGGILTITGTTTLTGDSSIRVCEGGILIIDGGILQNADLTLVPGSTLIIKNDGVINMATEKAFEAPEGAIVNIESGEIF